MDSERYDTITKNTNSFSGIDAEPYSTSGLTIYNNSSNVNNIIGSGTIINNNQIINNLVFKDVLNELVHSPAQSVSLWADPFRFRTQYRQRSLQVRAYK